jgi:ribose transport system permease protein
MTVLLFIIIATLSEIGVRKSVLMRMVFYTGSNPKAAAYSGINVDRVKILSCMACSVFAALAGIIYLNKFSGVSMTAGVGMEMTAIASAVIGGVSIYGGKGSILGAILGLTLMALVQNGMTLFNVPAAWQDLVRYLIVLGAVTFDAIRQYFAIRRTQ